MNETAIMHLIRSVLNASGQVRVVRNQVGFDAEHKVRYGLGVGSPDLIGVLRNGRAFGVEVKSGRGRLTDEQAAWWRAARAWGIGGGVARSQEEALQLLEEVSRQS